MEGRILASVLKISVSESVVPGGATSPLPENVLGLQILKSHLKPTVSETTYVGPSPFQVNLMQAKA